jgi:hypothetical protein
MDKANPYRYETLRLPVNMMNEEAYAEEQISFSNQPSQSVLAYMKCVFVPDVMNATPCSTKYALATLATAATLVPLSPATLVLPRCPRRHQAILARI